MNDLSKTSLNVNDHIAPDDRMFENSREHYFAVGQSALDCIRVAMLAAKIDTFTNILDMPCGHGRVLRHLQAAFPNAKLTACDIEPDAVDFCAQTFGATPVYAKELPKQMTMPGDYDLIFVGSLLTHLNQERCIDFLRFFRCALRQNGLLVFTMHGRLVAHRMRERIMNYGLQPDVLKKLLRDYEKRGFGYANYPKKKIAEASENYGISLSASHWLFAEIEKLEDLRIVNFTEQGWDNHQDVIACARV